MERQTFLEVKKAAKVNTDNFKKRKVAVLGEFATQHFCVALRGVAAQKGLALDILEADYDQIEIQLLNRDSETYRFSPDEILVLPCTNKLYHDYLLTPENMRTSFAESQFCKIQRYISAASQYSNAMILFSTYLEKDDRVFGNYGSKTEVSFIFQQRKLNWLIMSYAAANEHINIVDLTYLKTFFSGEEIFDPKMYFLAKIPYSLDVLPTIAELFVDVIQARMGLIKKCVILDLDNTIWGGVVGDDGYDGIQIGDLGTGQAFSLFQSWLKQLKYRGVLLAVCSKNEESAAKEPFLKNREMILKLEDFSLFVANWENKAHNISEMQKTLNIGMDSIVFIDDNPFERDAVRQLIPQLTVPEMPKDPALYVDYLESLNLFETISFSEEDAKRTEQYRSEIERVHAQSSFTSFDDYLSSLEMEAEAKVFDPFHYPRIAQLSQRSNQFNLRTVRYSESDVRRISKDDHYITRYFTLTDKFGDYGLIGVVILERTDSNTAFIESWFMSCRVLKRGMEEFIINAVVQAAKEAGCQQIIGEYIPTVKNKMVKNLYPEMGFALSEKENIYTLNIEEYKPKPTKIKIKK